MKACSADQMCEIDRRAVAEFGMPSLLLMENAGRAVAERVLAHLPAIHCNNPLVRVLCGRGNNGGDGFVAARHLFNRGVRVECVLAADREGVRGDARVNLDLLAPLGVPVFSLEDGESTDPHLLVDALLGTGFRGEPRGAVAEAIRWINASGLSVVSVDVPSGLDADTGRAGAACVRARETVTFGLPKLGLVSYPGRDLAGAISVAHISLPRPLLEEESLQAEWITPPRAAALWPERSVTAHKGESGRLFVLAGSPGLTGAAAMTCDAAVRAGAGLVTLGIPASLNPILEVKLTEAMTLPLPETDTQAHCPESLERLRERLAGVDALVAGPGFGRDPRSGELLRGLLRDCATPAVIDADGLNLVSPAEPGTFPANCVITPHPGEMARLLGTEIAEVQSNRLEVARSAATRFGCVVLLKGAATVVAAPDGRAAINSSGGPALATGGSGDVLTGIIGACLARGLQAFDAAVAGAYLHGVAGEVAAERFGAPGATASDVIAGIPEALRRLRMGEVPLPYRIV